MAVRSVGVAVGLAIGLSALPGLAQEAAPQEDTATTVATTTPPSDPSTTASPPTTSPETAPSTETTLPPDQGGTTSTTAPATSTTLSAADRRAKAEAAGRLNAALAADSEIAAGLRAINEVTQNTQSKVDRARSALDAARQALTTATEELTRSNEQKVLIENQLRVKAVEGFKSGVEDAPPVFFAQPNVNAGLVQTHLLKQANKGTAELLEELRNLEEDQRVAQAEATAAAAAAEQLQVELEAELANLDEQRALQLRLKREAEARISRWEGALSAYAAEDAGIQTLLSTSSPSTVTVAIPREPSALGFQWPVDGPITSGYGYRVHPVYGSRKLHSGIDVSAPRGTPIAAAGDGLVLSAGWRGGYGQTVIVDHGNGISTLYAHMSQISVREGATVSRGDQLGLVGATGTATGNHLHLEVRVGGQATDPRPFLP